MATSTAGAPPPAKLSLAPDPYDRLLAGGAMLLLLMVAAALWRGRSEWGEIPPVLWTHLVTITVALVLTPVMLLRRHGDRLHRRLGWLWCAAMAFTAAASFGIADINQGRFSPIHLLSAFTLLQVPVIAWSARAHKVADTAPPSAQWSPARSSSPASSPSPPRACWVDGSSDEPRQSVPTCLRPRARQLITRSSDFCCAPIGPGISETH